MGLADNAIDLFKDNHNCCQAVLLPFAETLEADKEKLKIISAGFGGSMATGKTCGAVTGSYMIIGLHCGRKHAQNNGIKTHAKNLTLAFNQQFESKFRCTACKELLGYDLGNNEERKLAAAKGLFEKECPRFVAKATEIVEALISK